MTDKGGKKRIRKTDKKTGSRVLVVLRNFRNAQELNSLLFASINVRLQCAPSSLMDEPSVMFTFLF